MSVHKEAAAYAAKSNIKLSVEPLNRFECYVLNTVADAADVVRQVGAPNYGLLYDTFHGNIEEKDPVGVIAPHIAQINHVHFSENDRGTPGKGHVPWAATMKALKQAGYDDWCVIEAFGPRFQDLWPRPASGATSPRLPRKSTSSEASSCASNGRKPDVARTPRTRSPIAARQPRPTPPPRPAQGRWRRSSWPNSASSGRLPLAALQRLAVMDLGPQDLQALAHESGQSGPTLG